MNHDLNVTAAAKTALRELVSRLVLRGPPATAAISRLKIAPYQGEVAPPKPLDLDEIAQRVVEQFTGGLLPERRDLRHAGFCVWETKTRLAEQPAALETYLKRIGSFARKSEYKRLAEAYFRTFDPNAPTLPKVAAILANLATRIGGDWGRRAADYCVFDPARGPIELAQIVLNQETDVVNYLGNRDSMPQNLASAKFAEAAWREGLNIINAEAQGERERFDFLRRWNGPNERTFLFDDKLLFVEAIISPYRKSGPEDRGLRDQILNYLLGLLGDPRISPERWTGLEGPKVVVNRWLVDQSFRQFLDVVERISENEQHWEYRRSFWEAVHQKCESANIPLNTWVIFASKGEHVAKRLFGSHTSFGVFRDTASQFLKESHAALMVEIGNYLFVDWNEHGPCNVWRRNASARRPQLYQQIYRRDQLRHPSPPTRTDDVLIPAGIFDHRGSLNFKWQERLAKEISDAKGPRLRQIDYRPKSR